MPATPEERRLLNHWNARRHGWARVEAGNRRAAERILRRLAHEDAGLDTDTQPPTD